MLPGRFIGERYRIIELIAAGGYGQVWRAHDERLGAPVALKQIKVDPTASPDERARLIARAEREARNAAALRDAPNVVAVHDVVTEDGLPWVVMRLVDGGSLAQVLERHPRLAPRDAVEVVQGVLEALRAAHRVGIVHRDVKPANIMLTSEGQVLLADFGIAKHRDDDASLTATGMVIGSLEYMAPERFGSHPKANGAQGDLFSLGAVLFEMLEGRSPFRRPSVAATMAAVAFEPHPPLQNAGPLTALVEGLLAKNPDDRLTAEEAIEAVRAASRASTTVAQGKNLPPRQRRTRAADLAFDVILESVPDDKKIQVIMAIRVLTTLGLREAKQLAENTPGVVLAKVDNRSAGGAEGTLRDAGAVVTIRESR